MWHFVKFCTHMYYPLASLEGTGTAGILEQNSRHFRDVKLNILSMANAVLLCGR